MQRSTLARTLGASVVAMSLLTGGTAWAQAAGQGDNSAGGTATTTTITTTTIASGATGAGPAGAPGAAATSTTTAKGSTGMTTMAARRVDHARTGRMGYAITPSNRLLSFDVRTPYRLRGDQRVRGLAPGETVVGIDFRPANGKLYAVGSTSRVYVVDLASARATAVGAPFTPALDGQEFGVDFNPQADRLRVVSNLGQNLRIVPDTGQVAANTGDTPLTYLKGDAFEGILPRMVGSAYTNNVAAAPSTQLFDIDARQDTLALQNPPNDGTLKTIGELRVDANRLTGFDIYTANGVDRALASLTPAGYRTTNLYQIDLTTGRASLLGSIGRFGNLVRDIAITP
jgi:hypothetical protein